MLPSNNIYLPSSVGEIELKTVINNQIALNPPPTVDLTPIQSQIDQLKIFHFMEV